MRLRVHHVTRYSYAVPMALGPHLLRLTPRGFGKLAQDVQVTPEPAFRLEETDAWGNRVIRLGFAATARALTIDSLVSLDTGDAAPAPEGALEPYRDRTLADPAIETTAQRLRALAGPDPQAFAESLTQTLYAAVELDPGAGQPPRGPRQVLVGGIGSSGEVAGLFIELCRRAGLPARFVTGYRADSPQSATPRVLHVWPEVHLPGQGWQGYDPTRGRAVDETHVGLAVAPDPAGTLPVAGSYFGAETEMEMKVSLNVQSAR